MDPCERRFRCSSLWLLVTQCIRQSSLSCRTCAQILFGFYFARWLGLRTSRVRARTIYGAHRLRRISTLSGLFVYPVSLLVSTKCIKSGGGVLWVYVLPYLNPKEYPRLDRVPVKPLLLHCGMDLSRLFCASHSCKRNLICDVSVSFAPRDARGF